MAKIRLVRAVHLSCGYSYRRSDWSEAQNKEAFGSLHLPAGVGYNLKIEATFTGSVDPLTGMVVNLADIDRWLKKLVEPLDHHYLNRDVEFFQTTVPTSENIARYCFSKLKQMMSHESAKATLENVRVFEGDDTWADFGTSTF